MKNSNWFKNPSGKLILIVLIVWFSCLSLLVMSLTDGFIKALPYNVILLLILPSFIVVLKLLINYYKSKL